MHEYGGPGDQNEKYSNRSPPALRTAGRDILTGETQPERTRPCHAAWRTKRMRTRDAHSSDNRTFRALTRLLQPDRWVQTRGL